MAPANKVGTALVIAVLGLSGLAEASAGRPALAPRAPGRFVMDGRPWVPVGYTPGLGAFTVRKDGTSIQTFARTYHSWLAARDLNFYRALFSFGQSFAGTGIGIGTEESLPYLRTGPGTAADGKPRFDLDRFDQAHFASWRRIIEDAGKKGIVVQLALFDSWHLNRLDHGNGWGRRYDVYADGNNVNDVGFDLADEGSWHRADGASPVYQRQKELVDRVVAELGNLPNLIWEICNEPGEYLEPWALPLAHYLWRQDRGRHLVVPIDYPDHQNTPGSKPPEHGPAATHSALLGLMGRGARVTPPLIVHNDSPGTFLHAAGQREKAWATLTAGAYLNYFFNLEDLRDLQRSSARASRGAAFIGRLRRFLKTTGTDLQGMKPCDSRVRNSTPEGVWCIASPRRMILYKRALPGNDWILIKHPPTHYHASWFDPRSGTFVEKPAQGRPAPGGQRFSPPRDASKDWVLHLAEADDTSRSR